MTPPATATFADATPAQLQIHAWLNLEPAEYRPPSSVVDGTAEVDPGPVSGHIRGALQERGVPPWARTSVEEIDAWLTGVLNVLDRRGAIVHRVYFARAVDDDWVQHGQRTNRVEDARSVSAPQMTATLAELDHVSSVGTELFHSLLPKLAHGVFEYYYGPDAGKLIVAYIDGAGPPRPNDDDRARWHSELNRRYPGYFEDSPPPEECPNRVSD